MQPLPEASVSQHPTLLEILLLVGIVLLAGGLRAYQLGTKSLWLDEILLVGAAQQSGLLGSYGSLSAAHPPAYIFLLRLVSSVSQAEWALRLPAMMASTAGVAALWALGRSMFGSLVGLLAAFFLALSPLHIEYAQEAHTYALAATLSTLLLWSLWRAAQRESASKLGQEEHAIRRWSATWGPFVLFAVLSLYTERYAWAPVSLSLVIFPLFLLATGPGGAAFPGRVPARRAALRRLVIALAAVGLAALPLLISQLTAPAGVVDQQLAGIDVGSLQPTLRLDSALFSSVLLAFVTYRPSWSFRPIGIALGLWLLLPIVLLAWLASRSGSALAPRHLIFVLPVFTLVVATGVTAVARLGAAIVHWALPNRRRLAAATNGLLLAVFVLAFIKGSTDPVAYYYRKPKQDWKTLAAILESMRASASSLSACVNSTTPSMWPKPLPTAH